VVSKNDGDQGESRRLGRDIDDSGGRVERTASNSKRGYREICAWFVGRSLSSSDWEDKGGTTYSVAEKIHGTNSLRTALEWGRKRDRRQKKKGA